MSVFGMASANANAIASVTFSDIVITVPRTSPGSCAISVRQLLVHAGKVVGIETDRGQVSCGNVISVQNIWSKELEGWTGIRIPVSAERHTVVALEGPDPYTFKMPVFKDLASPGMLYCRSYGGTQMLVSEGTIGETLAGPDDEQGPVSMDYVAEIGMQVAARFPSF